MICSSKIATDDGSSVAQLPTRGTVDGSRKSKNYKLGLSVGVCVSLMGWLGIALLALRL
ncbi:hypothetical protein NJ75_04517 [Novosphingobium subterraneum]|uniref:Uncharacterized protein n=1 Tax=Novosphingobium subterraneum TaxID=48936 RepID=A0A0B8ZXE6_9SPHN|nr:hypothetical protein NJ75_04517 [Novosphingobium subterraneum]